MTRHSRPSMHVHIMMEVFNQAFVETTSMEVRKDLLCNEMKNVSEIMNVAVVLKSKFQDCKHGTLQILFGIFVRLRTKHELKHETSDFFPGKLSDWNSLIFRNTFRFAA
jgi:hypothetical protein